MAPDGGVAITLAAAVSKPASVNRPLSDGVRYGRSTVGNLSNGTLYYVVSRSTCS